MSNRITGGLAGRNPFGNVSARPRPGTERTRETVGEQVQSSLFGKKKPPILEVDDAHLAAQMARLHGFRKRLARLCGDEEDDYDLTLAGGTIAMIDAQGLIYIGKAFLLAHADNLDVLVGVLAHEIGHRPKRWSEYKQHAQLSREDMEKLCRTEETRADYFAGRALAELGLSADPLCAFLLEVQDQPHPEYFAAPLRADVIREGFSDGHRQSRNRAKFFPEFARARGGGKFDLGSG